MEDLNDKVIGGELTAPEWNQVSTEIQNVIENTGQTLTAADLRQLEQGISLYSGCGDFYTQTGPVTSITLQSIGAMIEPPIMRDGLLVRFRPTAGAVAGGGNMAIQGLGVRSYVRMDGSPIQPGDFGPTRDAWFVFDQGSDIWRLLPFSNPTPRDNLLDNGDFSVWQHSAERIEDESRGVTASCAIPGGGNDDYDIPIDRWHLIGDAGTDIADVFRRNSYDDLGDDGQVAWLELVWNGSGKVGIVQNLTAAAVERIRSHTGRTGKASLSFDVRHDNGVGAPEDIRAVVIKTTTNGRDVLAASPVNAWNGNGALPSLVVGESYESATSTLGDPASGTTTRYAVEDITISDDIVNLRVMIWVNDVSNWNSGEHVRFGRIKLEPGEEVTAWKPRPFDEELYACRLHYQHLGHQEADGSAAADKVIIATGGPGGNSGRDSIQVATLEQPMWAQLAQANVAVTAAGDFAIIREGSLNASLTGVSASGIANYSKHKVMIFVDGNLAENNTRNGEYHLLTGGAADADGWFDAGVHVRSDL